MILWLVLAYFLFLVGLSFISKRFISSEKDYLLAGRSLPLSLSTFALFATWFGSETILGASQEFVNGGLLKVIEEPFGAALCLILAGMFFVKPLYRMNLLTFADFYKVKYGENVENIASVFLVISYFGWIAAQFVAFGLIFKTISGLPISLGIIFAFFVSVLMVYFGGMWAIAITDFIQTILILLSVFLVFGYLVFSVGGLDNVLKNIPSDYFKFLPDINISSISEYILAWIVIGLGSIPGQDLFQRFMSSKSEKVAVYSSYLAGLMYLSVALIPLIIAGYSKFSLGFSDNSLLEYINMVDPILKVLFFFGILSAILSTSSAAILAPSAIITENILPKVFKTFSKFSAVFINRVVVVIIGLISMLFAFSEESIYQLVASSSVITLVSLFAPLVFGIYWKKASSKGAIYSILGGFSVWFVLDIIFGYHTAGILSGFFVNILFMIIFSIR
ncbi:MAG: sodium:solute symporter family protein [Hydrogenothermaceae bacterium]|nr:sodium:solute symporter family protein [Hydrogenothermaceae bacterium]